VENRNALQFGVVTAPDVFAPATLGLVRMPHRTVEAATFEGRAPHGPRTR